MNSADENMPLVSMSTYLGARSFRVIQLHFHEGLTQAEIAVVVGLSQQRVAQLMEDAMNLLRQRPGVIFDLETILH